MKKDAMNATTRSNKEILRELAKRYAEIAALPIHSEKKELWRKLNGLKPARPMVMIDQVCWNEMDLDGELSARCADPFLRAVEIDIRTKIYQWEHFPADMVFEPWVSIPKAVCNSGFGIKVSEETALFEPGNSVVSHKFENLFQTDEDVGRIQIPKITHDRTETERRLAMAHEIFDGILELRAEGVQPHLSLWDPLATWMSVEEALFAMIDRPAFIHSILSRMTEGYLNMLDQLEEQGLLCQPQSTIHCTGAFTDELPVEGYDPERPRCRDIWIFGMAQMLSTISPEMFDEFEIQYTMRICEKFGLVYYGCCDPLDRKIAQVRKLPNVRKISMSPWADPTIGASGIGPDFVFSSKPNPANLAMDSFDPTLIRCELTRIRKACDENGCPLEFILKDLSTIRHEPTRLDRWAAIAMEIAEA